MLNDNFSVNYHQLSSN